MTQKHVELFFGSAIWLVLFSSLVLPVAGLVFGGFTGLWTMLQIVGVLLAVSVLVLGLVPVAAALLVTGGKKLAGERSTPWRELLWDTWVTCCGCTLIVVSYGGGLAWLYDWLVRPIMQ